MTLSSPPLFLPALGLANALGQGKAAVARGLFRGDTSGMVAEAGWLPSGQARVGRVPGDLPEAPSRTFALLLAAAEEIRADIAREAALHGPSRIGVVLGTSTSGIAYGEAAVAQHRSTGALPGDFDYALMEMGSCALFLARRLGLSGPCFTVSTACTSSGKAMAAARDLLRLGLCDAVVTGGADGLCKLTVNGFQALGAVSGGLCNPFSRNRAGINIGEGAALFILRREPAEVALLGVGASSDAYHISSPDPEGRGAQAAMAQALADAGLGSVDYLNLHATATPKNDEMEALAVSRILPPSVPCSGTKPLTGHTLGASAATELAFCWLTLQDAWNPEGRLPPHRWDGAADPALPPLALVPEGAQGRPRTCMSNAFAFGGNNLSLVVGLA